VPELPSAVLHDVIVSEQELAHVAVVCERVGPEPPIPLVVSEDDRGGAVFADGLHRGDARVGKALQAVFAPVARAQAAVECPVE
jgi:hypothetical protein